jgi:hypothetical protein
MLRTITGYLLGATAFVACPCHLPITLPLLLALLGGTSVGAFVAGNQTVIVLGAGAYFLLALGGAWWLLRRRQAVMSDGSGPGGSATDASCCPPGLRGVARRIFKTAGASGHE